jgi:F0F1-type ATP synthase assembly protein I
MSSGAHPSRPASRSTDPWVAASRLGGGVLLYGGIGWLLDRWWDTAFLAPVGILVGAALGLYVTFVALRPR